MTWTFGMAVVVVLTMLGGEAVGQPPPSESEKIAEGLMSQAETEGIARVIVEVQPSDPQELAAAGADTRGVCANEECAKLRVQQSLDTSDAPLVEDLGGSQLVMEVTPGGLEALAASPFVQRIVPDALTPVPPDPESDAEPGPSPDPGTPPPRRPPGLDEPF